MDAKAEKLALFRYGVIASLVIECLPRGELTRRAQEIAARHYDIPDSKRTAVSVDTLLDWAGRCRHGGFEALAPKPRQDRGQSRTGTTLLGADNRARHPVPGWYRTVHAGGDWNGHATAGFDHSLSPYQPEGRGKIERFFRTVNE
jgi:hypothetical protein